MRSSIIVDISNLFSRGENGFNRHFDEYAALTAEICQSQLNTVDYEVLRQILKKCHPEIGNNIKPMSIQEF